MSYNTADYRNWQAQQKRYQREARKRQREIERAVKEQAKLSALEQSRLEVEAHENSLEVLLSVHKEQTDPRDWRAIAATLPPPVPRRLPHNEFKARQRLAVGLDSQKPDEIIQRARAQDEQNYQQSLLAHQQERSAWERMSDLARRVLEGESKAYIEALEALNPFAEISNVGSSLRFTVHSPTLLECVLAVQGRAVIPGEIKTLTQSGKVSSKPMPRARFVELYQDYVCSCVLRVAREAFALLPIEVSIISASVTSLDSATGHDVERPILSVAMSRSELAGLNFDRLDPSDAIMGFVHRGDVRTSRRTGEFESIVPLTLADLPQFSGPPATGGSLLTRARELRAEIVRRAQALQRPLEVTEALNGDE